MSKTLFLRFQLAEAKGEVPQGMAARLTFATIAELGVKAVAEGYYGSAVVGKALAEARTAGQREQGALEFAESLIADIRPLRRILNETHTTSDFPLALANLRNRVLRAGYEGPVSDWRNWASTRTVPDFKPVRGLRVSEMGELLPRAELEDVKYASFGETEDGYAVGNYERALAYSWEMWKNDEISAFQRGLESLGRAARRTEALVVFRAIAAGLTRITDAGQAGAPTITTLKAVRTALGGRTFTDSDGIAVEFGFDITDIVFGTANRDAILQILAAETEPGASGNRGNTPNVLRGAFTPHYERLWQRIFGTDYVVFDRDMDWLEVAYLEGFEGGPLTYTKLPDVVEHPDQGSFSNHKLEVKVGHTLGAKVIDQNAAARVAGQ